MPASQMHFLANKNAKMAGGTVAASKLHNDKAPCCTAEWPYRPLQILCPDRKSAINNIERPWYMKHLYFNYIVDEDLLHFVSILFSIF